MKFLVLFELVLCGLGLKLYVPPTTAIVESFADEEVPGIQYISRGYNIFFGNPHTTAKVDGGISGAIFNLLNCSNGQIYNGYLVPNGVSILPAPTCVEEFNYNAVTGVNSYSSTLQESAKVDAKFTKISFSASTDYQKVYNETSKTHSVYTSTYTQCACYYASLKAPYALPEFDENFIGALKHMPLKYDPSDATNLQYFYDFFTKYFGTHYITDITMGGIFGTLSSMDSFSYSKFQSSNLDIAVSAKWSTVGASGAASSMTNSSVQQASDFDSLLKSKSIFNIGGDLPTNNSAATWQRSLSAKPMPMYYNFDPIPHLLTTLNFPNIPDITNKQSALQAALDAYCDILSSNDTFGKIECSGYPPDPTIPGKSIIKGFYSQNIDKEPTNPYTNGYNCNQGFTPIKYGHYWSEHGKFYDSFYCLNTTMGFKDELNYFGGLFEMVGNNCKISNVFTDKCTCPDGFISQLASGGITSTVDAVVFLCYNGTVKLDESILGGMYTTTTNPINAPSWPNPYTRTTSCPFGFTPYKTGKMCYYHDGCYETRSSFICLNNIYPV